MRTIYLSVAVAALAVMGLLFLLSTGQTVASTAPAPDSSASQAELQDTADGEPHVKFEGAVEDRPAGTALVPGDWRIGGITVTVSLTTTLDDEHGPPVLGAWVEVEGWQLVDGSVLAEKIETKRGPDDDGVEFEFKGIIEDFPEGVPGYVGSWQVSGISFTVNQTTTIEGTPALSDVAEVEALRASDGTLIAKSVEIEDREDDENEREWKGFIEILGDGPPPRYEGEWVVGGISVTVDAATDLRYTDTFTVGDWVEVKAYEQPDGSLLGDRIEIEDRDDHDEDERDDVKLYGVIQHITPFEGTWPVTWEIGHVTIWLTGTTVVDESEGLAVVGAWAEVEADEISGELWARKIEIEHEGERDDDEAEIEGLVTSLSPLIIASQEIFTDSDTVIIGTPALSVTAEAKGRWVSNPTVHFLADRVEFEGDDDGRSHYEIEGAIASLPPAPGFEGTWVLTTTGDILRSFEVTASTRREFEDGDPMVGCWAEAETVLLDDVETALEVEVEHCGPRDDDGQPDDGEYFEHRGVISQLGDGPAPRYEGEWVVGDISFSVLPSTIVDTSEGAAAVGREASVKATGDGGAWVAFKIEIKGFDAEEDDDHLSGQSPSSVAASQPGFSAANVSRTSGHSRAPDLVVRASGDRHLVWEESDGWLYHSWVVEGGVWSLPMPISSGSRPDAQEIAGTLYLVWSDDDGSGNYEIYLARWDDAAAGWRAPKNVSHTGGQSVSPDISADQLGNLHFAWADNTPGYWVIYHGTLTANAPVSSAHGQAPKMTVAADGITHLTWQDDDLAGVPQIYYSRLGGSGWNLPQDISHSEAASTVPSIALDGSGSPYLAWEEMGAGGAKDIFFAQRDGAGWSAPVALAATAADSFLPRISFGTGALHIAWTEAATASTDARLLYRQLSDGDWSPLQSLFSNGTGLSDAVIEVDASGKLHTAWANYTGSGLVNPTMDWDVYYGGGHLMTHQIYLPILAR